MGNESPGIKPSDSVTVTQMNHVVEVQYMEKMNRTNHIQKLDKDRYVDKRTGEIKFYEHIDNREGSLNSLRQTFKKMRYLINNNFIGNGNELHITLTYAENMTDTKRLYSDLDKFMKRLKYKYRDVTTLDYMNVIEPQGRGAWHCHLLIRFNDLQTVYIPNSELAELWGQGFIKIKSLKDIDNIGAYLSAYLADIELEIDTLTAGEMLSIASANHEVTTKIVSGQEKKFIKGGRLRLYPPGMNLYRKSKGIVFPERRQMRYENVKKVVQSAQPNYSKAYTVKNDDFENTIIFEQYNLKR